MKILPFNLVLAISYENNSRISELWTQRQEDFNNYVSLSLSVLKECEQTNNRLAAIAFTMMVSLWVNNNVVPVFQILRP